LLALKALRNPYDQYILEPWYARIGVAVLTQQGIAVLLSLILTISLMYALFVGYRAEREFEAKMSAQMATMNERINTVILDAQRIEAICKE
jgi:hypothetical protein